MHRDRGLVWFLATLASIWSPLTAVDRPVTCLLGSSCLLPCPFDPGPEVVIHWLHPPELNSPSVHSFYHGSDQLGLQLVPYRGRTTLFPGQINKGNASLLLSGVQLQDQGRYKCYTSTITGNNEDFINVEVEAPVRKVSLEEHGSVLNCVSKEVFPRPRVSWTPDSEVSFSVEPTDSGLFSVISSVIITDRNKDYSCNVSTEHSWRSATYRRTDGVTWSGSRTALSCAEPEEPIQSLVWTFNRTQTIFTKTGTNWVYSSDWKTRLEQGPGPDLVLTHLTQDQQGLYSCELSTGLSTYLTLTEVTVEETTDHSPVIIAVVVTTLLLLLLVIGGIVFKRWWKTKQQTQGPASTPAGPENTKMLAPSERTSDSPADSSSPNGL